MIDVTRPPFNAVGDGLADDTFPIQMALNHADPNVLFPEGKSFKCINLMVPSGKRLHMQGASFITQYRDTLPYGRVWTMATNQRAEDIILLGGHWFGRMNGAVIPNGGFFIAFRGDAVRKFRMDGTHIQDYVWDNAHFGGNTPSSYITLERCIFEGATRNNVSVVFANHVTVLDCDMRNTRGDNPGAGIDIEPNANQSVSDVLVANCRMDGCSVGIYDHSGLGYPGFRHRLLDNLITGTRRMGIVCNELSDLDVAGNDLSGQAVYPGPPQFLTIGISCGASVENDRTNNFTIRNNKVRGHSRDIVCPGVSDGEIVNNDCRNPEFPGLGMDDSVFVARNYRRA